MPVENPEEMIATDFASRRTGLVLPSYDHPPVVEFVAGVEFEDLQGWCTGHFGQFWSEIQADYPGTEDSMPLFDSNVGSGKLMGAPLPLPPLRRVFLTSKGSNYVIQLQVDRFHLNWRRIREGDQYPRFEAVFSRFQNGWTRFIDFVGRSGLPEVIPRRYSLTYLNHVDVGAGDFVRVIQDALKGFKWSVVDAQFLPEPASLGLTYRFDFGDRGTLLARLSHGKRAEGGELAALDLTASGPVSSNHTLTDWFATAHEWVVRGFTDLTTDEAHKAWGRTR